MRIVGNLLQHAPMGVLLALLAGFAFPDREPASLQHEIPPELTLVKETEHALFYVRDTDEDVSQMVDILSSYFEEHYPRITQMLKFSPPEKTTIFIYTDKNQFREMIGRDTEGTYDAGDRRIKVYTPSDLSDPDVKKEYTFQLVHEFVHAVIQQMNPVIGYIKWLDEGTAYFVANQLQDEIRSQRRFQAPIPSLEQLEQSHVYFEKAGGEAYYFSGLIVQFVYEKFGADAFNDFLRDPLAVESILGIPLPRLYDAWKEYVIDLHGKSR